MGPSCGLSLMRVEPWQHGYPRVHGLCYDVANGYLDQIKIDFKKDAKM